AAPRLRNMQPSDLNPANWVREGNRQAHLTYARGEKFVNDLRVVYEIRAMLASPQAAAPEQQNRTTPAPDRARPDDTGEHHTPDFRRDAGAPTASENLDWAMLNSALGQTAPNPANRRPL
ncbi:MAG: hypothetical protein KGL02_08445, partial [Acidobacteriota bacterium]|nr:hypothetical protein [Acidobacteriota bacterium]